MRHVQKSHSITLDKNPRKEIDENLKQLVLGSLYDRITTVSLNVLNNVPSLLGFHQFALNSPENYHILSETGDELSVSTSHIWRS